MQPSFTGGSTFTATVSESSLSSLDGSITYNDGTKSVGITVTMDPPKKTIGVVAPHGLGFWAGNTFADAIEAKGYIADVKIPSSSDNQTVQNELIRELLDGGAKVILVGWAHNEGNEIEAVMNEVAEKDVDIIAIDRFITDVNSTAYNHYVAVDSFMVGEAQGKAIAEKLDLENAAGPFNIALFAGGAYDSNALEFYDGAISILAPYIGANKLKVVGSYPTDSDDAANFGKIEISGWDPANAKTMMTTLLNGAAKNLTLDAVLAPNDDVAAAMIEALEADEKYKGRTIDNGFPIITGQDVSQKGLIATGKLYMSIDKGQSQIDAAVELADKLIQGESNPTVSGMTPGTRYNGVKDIKTYLADPVVITKEDL